MTKALYSDGRKDEEIEKITPSVLKLSLCCDKASVFLAFKLICDTKIRHCNENGA